MSVSAPDTTPPAVAAPSIVASLSALMDPAAQRASPDGARRPAGLVARAVGILSVQRRCSPEEGLRVLTELAARTGRSVPEQADRLIRRYPRLDSVLARGHGPADLGDWGER